MRMLLKMKKEAWLASLIAFITILSYLPVLQNGFVNWDDERYVVNNGAIHSLNVHFLKWAFSGFTAANWHPLTWISHAVDYAVWGLNPLGHHLTSIVLHGFNTLLVVLLTVTLLRRAREVPACDMKKGALFGRDSILVAAATTGLLFGIHPLHVESVAWISERKDLLYAFFFLISLLSYLGYAERMRGRNKRTTISQIYGNSWYLVSVAFFLFSLLSKPMAVTLPLLLLITDWYPLGRFAAKENLKVIALEKLPFVLLSLFSGLITLMAQNSGDYRIVPLEAIPLSTRTMVACKTLFLYIEKIIFPVNLIPLYGYPHNVSLLSPGYLIPLLLFVSITVACIFTMHRIKYVSAAWAFYVVTLLPILGFVQVGRQSMADRYMYLALLGPAILVGLFVAVIIRRLALLSKHKLLARTVFYGCLLLIFGGLVSAAILQMHIWKDGVSLWTHEIQVEPQLPEAYQRRGNAFRKQEKFVEAVKDYTKAIRLSPFSEPNYYNDRGIAYANLGLFEKALRDFELAIAMNPAEPMYQDNRRNALRDLQRAGENEKK